MKAQTETIVLEKISKDLHNRLMLEVDKCRSEEKYQSESLDESIFQARAYSRFIGILLDEVQTHNKQLLFTTTKQ